MNWRRIAVLQAWLIFFPPVGWWLLWNEPHFSRLAKIRLLFYTYLIPLLVYLALILYVFNTAERVVASAGGGF